MLLSFSNNFIFIHIYRAAGTSIKSALKSYAHEPNQLIVNKILRKFSLPINLPLYKYKNYFKHITARDLKQQLPQKIYNSYFKFAFVRNPWDWQVSLYHYMLKDQKHFQHKFIKSIKNFYEYIEWRIHHKGQFQKEFVTDNDGDIIVDFIGRYENLLEDFQCICKILKIKTNLPYLNESQHTNYKSYYNTKSRKMVEEAFKEDIEFFGYTFD